MSAGSLPGQGSGQSQDVDLNLAPIIDCFTVLITFMLVSAAYLSIGILDAGISAGGAQTKDTPPPAITINLQLNADQMMKLEVTGKLSQKNEIKALQGEWNLAELKGRLEQIKKQFPESNAITLSAENQVEYKQVVKVLNSARLVMPAVMLGGF